MNHTGGTLRVEYKKDPTGRDKVVSDLERVEKKQQGGRTFVLAELVHGRWISHILKRE